MNKVITINLDGLAYQLEEGGYDALARLSGNRRCTAEGQSGS